MTLVDRLMPRVVGALSVDARNLIVAVIELAKGAELVGPPPPPPHVEAWSRNAAGARAPWQLVAAALAVVGDPETVPALLGSVAADGLVPGVRAWAGDPRTADAVLMAFLAFTARQLDAEGLDLLAGVFGA